MSDDPLPTGTEDLLAELAAMGSYVIGERASYDWPAIEADLGVRLPSQYKAYAECFPPGTFRGLLVYHPAMSEPPWPRRYGLVESVKELSSGLRPLGSSKPAHYRTYPEPGGLMAWADCEGDYCLSWLPNDENPDRWQVIAYEMGGDDGEPVDGSTLQALIQVLRGDAGRKIFPGWFWDEPMKFVAGDPANG